MRPKHIVQVSSYYPPHLGGQENVVYGLAQQLASSGNDVHVLTSAEGGGYVGTRTESNVLTTRLRSLVFGHAPIMRRFPLELWRAIRPNSVVHLHIGQAFTPEIVWLISKLRHFPYIAELHIDFKPTGPVGILLPLYKHFILRRVLRDAHAVAVLNQDTLHTVRDAYNYSGPVHIVHNGIDEMFFTLVRKPAMLQPPQTLRLLFVGRLSKQKNLPALLRALSITSRKVHLDIVGEGEELHAINKLIANYKLTNITMHGRLERSKILPFYETCDALVMPSLYEAQPLVLLEAMAARIPIIGTDVIGVSSHIKDVGIVVQPTAKGLASGIELYDTYSSQLQTMVDKGFVRAQKFRWSHTLKEYEALYETIVGN